VAAGLLAAVVGAAYFVPFPVPAAFGFPERKEGDWTVTTLGVLQFSHYMENQHRLLLACEGKPPELWDTEKGKRIAVLSQHVGTVDSGGPSPDGKRFFTAEALVDFSRPSEGNSARSFRVWETATGKLLKRIDIDRFDEKLCWSTEWHVSWHGDGELFFRANCRYGIFKPSWQSVFGLVDVDKGRLKWMSEPLAIPDVLTYSPDHKRALATYWASAYRTADGGIGRTEITWITHTVQLLDAERYTIVGKLDDPKPNPSPENLPIVHVAWSPDGKRVATARGDHTVGVWDGLTGKAVTRLKGHTDWVLSACFSPDGEKVLTASNDNTARVWDARTGKVLATLTGHTSGLNDAAFDARGEKVLTGAEDQTARLWDAKTGKQLRLFAGHESGVRRVSFAAEGGHVYTETAREIKRYWSAADGSLLSEEKKPVKLGHASSTRLGVCFLKIRPGLPGNGGDVEEMWVGPPGATPPAGPPDKSVK
jgi:WD40 repeat protein